MNINIEKISNGYVITIGSKKTFCDVPEAICGTLAEWALEECKRLDAGGDAGAQVALKQIAEYMKLVDQQERASKTTFIPWTSTCSLDLK